jgi:hypothetical protein
METLGKGIDLVQVFPFDPILVLARSVALISARLKERDHYYLHGDRRWASRPRAGRGQDKEE